MAASGSGSEFVTALAPKREQESTTAPEFVTALEEHIKVSKCHWSELTGPGDGISMDEEVAIRLDNQQVFKTLQMHPIWCHFFGTFGYDTEIFGRWGSLEVGEKFAEGAQAELFHAHVQWQNPKRAERDWKDRREWVVKVFKNRTLVRHLQQQWPHGLFQLDTEFERPVGFRYNCRVQCATLLEDGRFAFLMEKEQEDLRSLIDRKMLESDHDCGPFSKDLQEEIMYKVALGMDWLHNHDIVHRDLKASNVLYFEDGKVRGFFVGDYECSVGVVGTGFWRAPEILQACKEMNVNNRPELFSRAADTYSYGMTCYEILTGKLPFQHHLLCEQRLILTDLVINQHLRPEVPRYVDDWVCKLLSSCWQSDPTARPSFKEILSLLEANSESQFITDRVAERLAVTGS